MKNIIIALLGLYPWLISAQVENQMLCKSPEFEQEVRNWLSFTVPIMTVQELKEEQSEVVLLDAREKKEYEVSHIPEAKHVGYDFFNPSALDGIDKDEKIVVYCSIGYRSEKIGEKLQKMGYKNVYNLYGSIFEWVNQDNPLVDPANQKTQKLHTFNKTWSKWVDDSKAEKKF